jgi:toxin ParE1/3/4
MGYQLLLSDESRLDIFDAFSWYEVQREGLGRHFELCLEAALSAVERQPLAYQKKYKEIHVYYITRFPYGIHYIIEGKEIKVIAIFHSSRNPMSWVERLA